MNNINNKIYIAKAIISGKTQKELYYKLSKILDIDEQDNPLYYTKTDHYLKDEKIKMKLVGISIYLDYKYNAILKLLVDDLQQC